MSGIHWRGAAWVLTAGVLTATLLVAASVLLVPSPPSRMALPSAGELVELERYLDPAAIALPESAGVPEMVAVEGDPFGAGSAEVPNGGFAGNAGVSNGTEAAAPPPPRWTLSAIMVAGDRKIAILNDRMVRPGDRLDDGARVERVESDHIVIITPEGARRRLQLERQGP